jgi:hypothetical protein
MNIIEKEIARREALIVEKAEKENKVIEMQLEIERLTSEIASTDEVALRSEIAELESYLTKPEEMGEEIATVNPYAM